jgi:hypothetical protein
MAFPRQTKANRNAVSTRNNTHAKASSIGATDFPEPADDAGSGMALYPTIKANAVAKLVSIPSVNHRTAIGLASMRRRRSHRSHATRTAFHARLRVRPRSTT